MMSSKPTTAALKRCKNRCEAITIAMSTILTLIIAHVDKFNDDITPSFNYLISLSWWLKGTSGFERFAVLGYSRNGCGYHMKCEEGIVQLQNDVKNFIPRLSEWRKTHSHRLLDINYAKDEVIWSKYENNKFGIQYFARIPHLNKSVYYSVFVHQLR